MAIQIVYWQSTDNVCCNRTLPIPVIICLDTTIVAQQSCPGGGVTDFPWPGIGAQLVDVYTVNNDCNGCLIYHYTIQYDDSQLVPGTKLETKDIQGMFCNGCLLQVVLASAGSEVSLRQNDDGSYTLRSQHGCEYTFAGPGTILVEDTPSLDLHIVGNTLSGDVNLSSSGGNQISELPDGLYVPPPPADFITATADTTTVGLNVTLGTLTAGVIISPNGGNQISDPGNGLYVPPLSGLVQSVSDTQSIDLDVSGNNLTANAIISPDPGNILVSLFNGLYVPPDLIQGITDTTNIDLDISSNFLSANVIVSTDPGNIIQNLITGLYVPTPPADFIQSVADTATVDLDAGAGILTANVNLCLFVGADGWTPACESWSAPSATTITVPSDATLKYAVGDKIRLVQDAITKYFYVIEVTATLLTVTAGTDFTLSGNPITDPFYSHALSPVGHPQRFTYTPTFTGFSVDPATPEVEWSLFGKMAHLAISTGEGVSNATDFTVSLLVPMFVTPNTFSARGSGWSGTDNSTFAGNIMPTISSLAPTILQFFPNSGATGWTPLNNKAANATIDYPIT